MNMKTFLANNQIFTIDQARTALELEKSSTMDNLLAYHLQRGLETACKNLSISDTI